MEPALPVPALGKRADPGIYGPESTTWHVGRERALLLGGGAALLLQIAHPLVAAGVVDHSDFRNDPFARLRGTLETMREITFGDGDQAAAAAHRVGAVHGGVYGQLGTPSCDLPSGTPYSATDPDLALWVHATLIYTALKGHAWFVGPISDWECSRYYEETKAQATLFGVSRSDLPETFADFRAYVTDMLKGPLLTGRGPAFELATSIFEPVAPAPLRAIARSMRGASAPFLPDRLRREFGLAWTSRERAAFRAATSALRRAVPLLPPAIRFWPHYRIALQRMGASSQAA
jgi:uncharacterized protein (DUF2236 family)